MPRLRPILPALLACAIPVPAPGQDAQSAAISKGVDYLKSRGADADAGKSALAALALLKAEVPADDPGLVACLDRLKPRFDGSSYRPGRAGGTEIYEAAVIALAYANADPAAYRGQLDAVARYLVGKQNGNGSWDYAGRSAGDCSISQYAILGLWEAENAGAKVPGKVWDSAARFFLGSQASNGGWRYHPDESSWLETVSMTAAGAGSLLICQKQLARYRKGAGDVPNPYLVPLVAEGTILPQKYDPRTTDAEISNAVRRGVGWLGSHLSSTQRNVVGPTVFYSLYGIERVGALADRDAMGTIPWFEHGLRTILPAQAADGHWSGEFDDVPNTAWAVLFLTRATAKTLKKIEIKRLKGGTLLGGRGLPDNIDNLTIAQGRVVVRPMNGAVEGMLSVLADPRTLDAENALAGLIDRYRAGGPKVLKPHKDRLRKLLEEKDPGLRRVGCWGLGRTGDLDVAPDLIDAIARDDDEAVVNEARVALQVLSRKIEGFGPAPGANAEERVAASRRWRGWYDAVRPPDRGPADDEPAEAGR